MMILVFGFKSNTEGGSLSFVESQCEVWSFCDFEMCRLSIVWNFRIFEIGLCTYVRMWMDA